MQQNLSKDLNSLGFTLLMAVKFYNRAKNIYLKTYMKLNSNLNINQLLVKSIIKYWNLQNNWFYECIKYQ